jgi:hypothetical protein
LLWWHSVCYGHLESKILSQKQFQPLQNSEPKLPNTDSGWNAMTGIVRWGTRG